MRGFKGRDTIIVLRKISGNEDEYGNKVDSWIQNEVKNCLVAWGSSGLNQTIFENLYSTSATIYFPLGTEILNGDKFIINGETYKMSGPAVVWNSFGRSSINRGPVVSCDLLEV